MEDLYTESTCGKPYKRNSTPAYPHEEDYNDANKEEDPFKGLIHSFTGVYSSYNLFTDGHQVVFTIDEYNQLKVYYKDFIQDPDLKCKYKTLY